MATTKYKKNNRGEWATQIWDGTYNADGTKHRKYLVSKKSSADLERKVQELKQQVANGDSVVFSDISFGAYAAQWFEVSKATKEANTRKMYGTVVNNYLSFLNDLPMAQLTHSHIQRAINNHIEHPKTCKNIRMTASQIVRSAIRDHILPRSAEYDLLSDLSLPKHIKSTRRPLTELEKQAFFDLQTEPMKQAYVSILYYLGTRKAEALALRPEDFDWKKQTVSISRVVIYDGNTPSIKPYPKSERGIRQIPVPDAMIPRVQDYAESCDNFLFHTQNGALMTDIGYRRMWESILVAMNVAVGWNPQAKKDRQPKPIQGLTAHIFRHNYCTQLCYQIPQITTKMIAKMLGDDERMVLEVYSHILAEKEDLAGAVASAFS